MAAHLCMGTKVATRREFLSPETKASLEAVVQHIGQPGKGISACDESGRTIDPRFAKVGVEPTEDKRRECLRDAHHDNPTQPQPRSLHHCMRAAAPVA